MYKKILLLGFFSFLVACDKTVSENINGESGSNGIDGKDGAKGADGVDGKDGKDGKDCSSTVIKSNGVEIGTLLLGDSNYYVFVNSDGYSAQINKVSGFIYPSTSYFETNDCTGQPYVVLSSDTEYMDYYAEYPPYSIYSIFRGNSTATKNKMFHVNTSVLPIQKNLLSYIYYTTSCNSLNYVNYWTYPIEEISEETSGIKIQYETPITLEAR